MPSMNLFGSNPASNTGLIDKMLDTDYKKVALVADNIDIFQSLYTNSAYFLNAPATLASMQASEAAVAASQADVTAKHTAVSGWYDSVSASAIAVAAAEALTLTYRDAALSYRDSALTYKNDAQASATAASASETAAAASSSSASGSATSASDSADAAAASEAAALASANAASSAQTAAEAARDSALTAYDNFDDRYLGPKASDPTVDNDGNALIAGALYYDTGGAAMKVYTGSIWTAAYVSGTGVLLVANNLSDIGNAATALANLGGAPLVHTHVIGDVTGLQTALDGKSATSHTHSYLPLSGGSVTGTVTAGRLAVSSTTYLDDDIGNGNPGLNFDSNDYLDYDTSANKLSVYIGSSEKFSIASEVTARTHLALDSGAADGANLIWRSAGYSDWNADNIYGRWRLYYGTTERFTITADGKVGLGVSSASYRLGVVDTGVTVSGNIASFGDSNIQNGLSLFSDDSGLTWGFNALNARALTMRTNQTDRVRIEGDGRVTFGGGAPQSAWMSIYSGAYDTGAFFVSSDRYSTVRFQDSLSGASGGARIGCDGDDLYIATGNPEAERFRIDSTGWIGMGTSNPTSMLHVANTNPTFTLESTGTGSAPFFVMQGVDSGAVSRMMARLDAQAATGTLSIQADPGNAVANSFMQFTVDASEKMRIDSGGRVLVGKTTAGAYNTVGVELSNVGILAATRDSNVAGIFNRINTDGDVIQIRNDNTSVGSISVSGSTTAYNTSSDYRLKNVDGPLLNSGAFIDALKPVRGSWKVDGSTFIGFIAHEVQEVAETPITTGEKDGEEMQSMTYSSPEMIAHMIAELQSLRKRVAVLEAAV